MTQIVYTLTNLSTTVVHSWVRTTETSSALLRRPATHSRALSSPFTVSGPLHKGISRPGEEWIVRHWRVTSPPFPDPGHVPPPRDGAAPSRVGRVSTSRKENCVCLSLTSSFLDRIPTVLGVCVERKIGVLSGPLDTNKDKHRLRGSPIPRWCRSVSVLWRHVPDPGSDR